MTEVSKRLKVNLKNVKRPINGVLPKKITRDVIGIEIPLRVFSRIKYDCNVYYTGKDKDVVIVNEQQFLELLKENEVSEKAVTFEKIEEPIDVPNSQEINVEPEVIDTPASSTIQGVSKETNDEEIVEYSDESFNKAEGSTEEVEETPTTTKDNNTTGSRKNNKRNNRR